MSIKDLIGSLNEAVKTYHIIDQKLSTVEKDLARLNIEFANIRLEHVRLEGRVSQLEEARKTIQAEVRADMAEAISRCEVNFARAEAQMKVEFIQATHNVLSTPRKKLPPSGSTDSGS